ncbi:PREDICTED: ankyrin repeat domain-containing protein SOWAHA [Ceratosolen solmsi marchali]|uniref:Ankyrin repeat domain-containing protein SOWAHA n=1 Tax=Ceratosolen solmsi marchali TaxID=326594 RepID=A0AAJ6YCF8_9HYME|nr:PREDICTED: ankyrin repeat domain-containing protein SOWAHA [Ceratosolen solmsi marchali]
MASPSELSLEEIRKYLLDNGGSALNQDVVMHFKKFLTDPETRVEARNRFKEYINTLATIKSDEGEKYLILRKKFRQPTLDLSSPTLNFSSFTTSPQRTSELSFLKEPALYKSSPTSPLTSSRNFVSLVHRFPQESSTELSVGLPAIESIVLSNTEITALGLHENYSISIPESVINKNVSTKPTRISKIDGNATSFTISPPVPPRRKSQDKIKLSNKENQTLDKGKLEPETIKEHEVTSFLPMNHLTSAEQLSVRERMQRFNRMASETDLPIRPNVSLLPIKKRSDKGAEEDDRASVASQQLDGKSREWLVRASQGDYQALAKLAAEEPRLARIKDPSSGYTALHWGAKHGDENIVKLIAGTYKEYIISVNETTNGGYTPLHIASQFDHENIFNLLVQVYGANQDIRDYSGKKARQYSISQKAAVSQDTIRKIKARKKHTEKDLGFLRIGSLNVRVKRTTEAFSQFLGVTNNASSNNEKIHKIWGSADNLPADKVMPPPNYTPIKKRRSRRGIDFISTRSGVIRQESTSQPGTPTLLGKTSRRPASVSALTTGSLFTEILTTSNSSLKEHQQKQNDSDSDGACGFDSAWRETA